VDPVDDVVQVTYDGDQTGAGQIKPLLERCDCHCEGEENQDVNDAQGERTWPTE
jgi:hypothetical protein